MAFKQITAYDTDFVDAFPIIAERWAVDHRTAAPEELREEVRVPLVDSEPPALVTLLSDESPEQQVLYEKHKGDLMTGVPTIAITLDGKKHFLTWAEAYNLGHAMKHIASIALFG